MREADLRPSFPTTAREGGAPWPLPSLYADWARAVVGRADASLDEARAKVEPHRARVMRLRDPFMPLAKGDAAARNKERVLFEDEKTLVIADLFASGPKALVVPAFECLFPCDMTPEEMRRLELVTGCVQEGFRQVLELEEPPRAWINPPGALTVRQLHVHVSPTARGNDRIEVEEAVGRFVKDALSHLGLFGETR